MYGEDYSLLWPLLISLFLPVGIHLTRASANRRDCLSVLAAVAKFALILTLLPTVLSGEQLEITLFEVFPGIPIALRADPFGMLFALVASFLWIVTTIYSIGYMRGLNEHSQTRFYCFFSWALFAAVGAAFAANLLTLYLFYELLSLSTWPLVTHHQDAEARSAGRRYLCFLLGSSIGLLLPVMILAYMGGTPLDFSSPSASGDLLQGWKGLAVFLMFILGFAKSGLMPLHSWLPAAMVAPTPVSALLHAVAVVKVGVFSIIRIVTGVFGVELLSATAWAGVDASTVLATLASITLLLSSIIAFRQKSLKRLLAFSTIGQLAYIVLGVSLLSPQGILASVAHIAFHAFGKITLFFCAGTIYVASGKKNIDQLSGIGRRMPLTMIAFAIGAASVIGLPPTAGFVSKWYLLQGCLVPGKEIFLVVILVSSVLKAGYFFPIVFNAFFGKCSDEDEQEELHAPLACVIAPVCTAVLSLTLLFSPYPFFALAEKGVALLF